MRDEDEIPEYDEGTEDADTRAAKKCKGIRLSADAENAINMHMEAMSNGILQEKMRDGTMCHLRSDISGETLIRLDHLTDNYIEKGDDGEWRNNKKDTNALYDAIGKLAVYDYADPVGSTGLANVVIVSWRERSDRKLRNPDKIIAAAVMIEKQANTRLETAKRMRKLAKLWSEYQ